MSASLPEVALRRAPSNLPRDRPVSRSQKGQRMRLELVLGELRSEVATARLEALRPLARLQVDGMLTTSIGTTGHRERVLPARHVRLQLGRGELQLSPEAFGHPW